MAIVTYSVFKNLFPLDINGSSEYWVISGAYFEPCKGFSL